MRVGSLFSGYGGLDMAVGGEVVWYSEIEPAACKVLAAHHPGVTNLGDIKKVDWSTVEPVDVLTGGYPCQPFSLAGLRKGTDDERHLWPYVRDAISALRPGLVVLENVRGHLSMGLASVIGDLAGLGYDAKWGLVRASDAGAPHARARVFIFAHANRDGHGLQVHARGMGSLEGQAKGHSSEREWAWRESHPRGPVNASDTKGFYAQKPKGQRPGSRHKGRLKLRGSGDTNWGKYEPAVRRWESLTRPAPSPVREGRLNPVFVEWLMGLPEGHVTGHGLSSAQELKMLGNGVCPQQAKLAIQLLTEWGTK